MSYEVDKSIRHTKVAQGQLKRLSVAVVVNDRKSIDKAGKITGKPLTDAEKQQITDLVKGVMGYDKERGDTLSVINSAFSMPEVEKVIEVPLWKDPAVISMAKDTGKYLLIAAFVLFLLSRCWKPDGEEPVTVPTCLQARCPSRCFRGRPKPRRSSDRYQSSLQNAKQIAKQDPKMVAHVVKDWVAGNEQVMVYRKARSS